MAGRQRPDVDDAEHPIACIERHAEERLDPLLAQDRVQHVGVVDVLDHDRRPLGGDAAGEAAADRDANAGLDLLLDPLRRTRDQLAGRLVEHEEGGGVGLEDVADAEEQLIEERVQRQVRERRVGDEQELVQPLARRLLGLEEPLVLDRERRALGHPLEEVDVVRREDAVRQRADVDDAAHLPAHRERRAEQRLDPLLAQDRIEDVGGVDVLDHHRRRLRSDPAGEAPAERDADARLHLLFDPLRGAGDELVRLLVEQQERGRVGLEDVADPDEQLVEQPLERQERERRVGDEQDLAQMPGLVGHGL